jgi:probable HAF family extracellular repeat protein
MPVYNFTTLADPAGAGALALGINDAGQIVGLYDDSLSREHGFLLSGGTYTPLDDPLAAAGSTVASGINNKGLIVGSFDDSGGQSHGFFFNGAFDTLDDPSAGSSGTFAKGINDLGWIVGSYYDSLGHQHGFLTGDGSHYTNVDDPLGAGGVGGERNQL